MIDQQLDQISRIKASAEQELLKFKVLFEGLKFGKQMLAKQLDQIRAQESSNPVSVLAFEGALTRFEDLLQQTSSAIAKNEGSFLAYQTMEKSLQDQKMKLEEEVPSAPITSPKKKTSAKKRGRKKQ